MILLTSNILLRMNFIALNKYVAPIVDKLSNYVIPYANPKEQFNPTIVD